MARKLLLKFSVVFIFLSALIISGSVAKVYAQPEMLHPKLEVRTVVSGLATPTTMAFLGPDDILVLEKNTGMVKRIINGTVQGIVLDLSVNFASERGLLGIALHPDFETIPFVYLYWTESTSGSESNVLSQTSLLGNRVDRFVWNGSALIFDLNIVRIRALQADAGQPERGNHNGGILKFGPDGKLYVFVGDVGRRGHMQNLPCGPTAICPGPTVPDDQFGGPEPDDAHFTGVVMRLNDDGTTPEDNPFFAVGSAIGGNPGLNIQKIFSYGHRNGFGMSFDHRSGDLWLAENGDDSFSEINRVLPGMNGGWVQIMGPVSRINQYKEIETSPEYFGLQQIRWSPINIADSPEDALSRLYMLPGAHYSDPVFSWKYEVAPAGIGFVNGRGLGPQFMGDLFIGAARDLLEGGNLFRLRLTGNRQKVAVDDPRLQDRVADNLDKWDITESESILIGRNFGVTTDIQTGPNGNLYVVSLTNGAIYEITGRTGFQKDESNVIHSFTLLQNYPNPFNPSTTIKYSIAESEFVTLKVYDVLGREVATLINKNMDAGSYEIKFEAAGLMSGFYIYKLSAGTYSESRKMMLLK
jgi:aldose sugar dehydrogenase